MQYNLGDLAGGFTYRDGRMEVLNFSARAEKSLPMIDKRLDGAQVLEHASVYSAYIEAHAYARPESDSRGNLGRQTARILRPAFSQRLEENLQQIRQSGAANKSAYGEAALRKSATARQGEDAEGSA